jgi:hypothetical protein
MKGIPRICSRPYTILLYHTCNVWGKREMHAGFWWGDQSEGHHLGDPGVDGRIILKWIFKT